MASRALTALNIAGFFVPGLGEAMLAVCVAQLAHEVYEGIEAWENDERDTAYGYLVDVIENVAIMAALSAAAKALKAGGGEVGGAVEGPDPEAAEVEEPEIERIPVETPSFIEELEDIEMPDGQVCLWKANLTPTRATRCCLTTLNRTRWAFATTKADNGWCWKAISTSSNRRQAPASTACNTRKTLAATHRQCGITVPAPGYTLPISR